MKNTVPMKIHANVCAFPNTGEGFTLIEVLIALIIFSISLTAIVKASSSDIRNTKRISDTAIAQWVAFDAFNLIKLGVITLDGNETTQETLMAEKKWRWHAIQLPTKRPHLVSIKLSVFDGETLILDEVYYKLDNKP